MLRACLIATSLLALAVLGPDAFADSGGDSVCDDLASMPQLLAGAQTEAESEAVYSQFGACSLIETMSVLQSPEHAAAGAVLISKFLAHSGYGLIDDDGLPYKQFVADWQKSVGEPVTGNLTLSQAIRLNKVQNETNTDEKLADITFSSIGDAGFGGNGYVGFTGDTLTFSGVWESTDKKKASENYVILSDISCDLFTGKCRIVNVKYDYSTFSIHLSVSDNSVDSESNQIFRISGNPGSLYTYCPDGRTEYIVDAASHQARYLEYCGYNAAGSPNSIRTWQLRKPSEVSERMQAQAKQRIQDRSHPGLAEALKQFDY